MSVPLADMETRLQNQVTARSGVPADYGQIVRDAIWQLSDDVPMIKRTTLSVVSGTAAYSLPTDFLYLIELERFSKEEVFVTDAGLVPMGADYDDIYTIVGQTITFWPTPTYSATRYYRYAAAYVLSSSEVYENLSQNGARVALLYAAYLALSEQATALGGGWRYQLGDEMVDKTQQGRGLQDLASAKLQQYQRAVENMKTYGTRARIPKTVSV